MVEALEVEGRDLHCIILFFMHGNYDVFGMLSLES